MKKTLFILAFASFLFACNSDSGKKETIESEIHQGHDTSALSLNNGAKWKADSITNANVGKLKRMTDSFKINSFPAVAEYRLLGDDLSNGLNIMIQECKMTGPDHEALHHWLEPILSETKELKNTSDTAKGRTIFNSLDKNIDSYNTYFE